MTRPSESDLSLFKGRALEVRDELIKVVNSSSDAPISESVAVVVYPDPEEGGDISIMYATCKRLIWDLEDQVELNPEDDTTKTLLGMVKRISQIPSAGLLRVLFISDSKTFCGRMSISDNPLC